MAGNKEQSREGITVKIDVEVSEAITGLKAVQREARLASKELRELESAAERLGAISLDSGKMIAEALGKMAEAGVTVEAHTKDGVLRKVVLDGRDT